MEVLLDSSLSFQNLSINITITELGQLQITGNVIQGIWDLFGHDLNFVEIILATKITTSNLSLYKIICDTKQKGIMVINFYLSCHHGFLKLLYVPEI